MIEDQARFLYIAVIISVLLRLFLDTVMNGANQYMNIFATIQRTGCYYQNRPMNKGIREHDFRRYLVPSSTGKHDYMVDLVEMKCDCMRSTCSKGKIRCKHIKDAMRFEVEHVYETD